MASPPNEASPRSPPCRHALPHSMDPRGVESPSGCFGGAHLPPEGGTACRSGRLLSVLLGKLQPLGQVRQQLL